MVLDDGGSAARQRLAASPRLAAEEQEGYAYPPRHTPDLHVNDFYSPASSGKSQQGYAQSMLPPGAASLPSSQDNARLSTSYRSDEGAMSTYAYSDAHLMHSNYANAAYVSDKPIAEQQGDHPLKSVNKRPDTVRKDESYASDKAVPIAKTTIGSMLKGYATPHQLGFLLTAFLQNAATVTMIAIAWAKINPSHLEDMSTSDNTSLRARSITVYLAIFLFGSAFEIATALDALRLNNTIQLIGVCIFTLAMMVYSALLDGQIENATRPLDGTNMIYPSVKPYIIAMPVINGAATLVLAYFTWTLYKDFGWEVLHLIGADRKLKRLYTKYQIFVCLLKFDFFFFVGFSLQYMILVLQVQEAEFIITIVAFPVTVMFLLLAAVAVRREIRWLTWIILFVELAGLAYFIFKFFRLFQASQAYRYETSRKTLAVFSALAIVMLLSTAVSTVLCCKNYGQGLKDNIPGYWNEHKDIGRRKMHNRKVSQNRLGMGDRRQSRMSID